MEELNSPPPCLNTVTVRRNPPRRARNTPYSVAPLSLPPSSSTKPPSLSSAIRSFPIHDILSIKVPDKPDSSLSPDSEKLKVFLRIKPIVTTAQTKGVGVRSLGQKNVWPQNPNYKKKEADKKTKMKRSEICLKVIDSHSVTLTPPQSVADVRRTKSEVYEGFSYVFSADSTQREVYEMMVYPLVVDFLKGKSGMLAAMGPSGSGKTHSVFGTTRDPGMVSLALREIFSEQESNRSKRSRTFYLSMFEIYSERGKGEKIMDLSHEGGDLYMQQSNIKGLLEAVIHDVQQAESLIASGMLKRSTAMTNSNIQSSRSQCIINIRCDIDNFDEDAAAQSNTAMLTIVDLAGAERERRTGNQGARLLESNFINKTSMVFGLCLRSLLEHQKNPKKPFHKHFQNSLLTKYLREYLEGKKRMALMLTAKSEEEDYQDTSYLLRLASPFMNIKFENVEEQPANAVGNKRRTQTLSKPEQAKRVKINSIEVCKDDEVKSDNLHQPRKAEKNKSLNEYVTEAAKLARESQILLNFSRALWNVLKEYKSKLTASENEVDSLRQSLTVEKERCSVLETELTHMKAFCSCGKEVVADVKENGSEVKLTYSSLEFERYQRIDVYESNKEVSSSHPVKLEITADTVTSSVTLLPECSNTVIIENQICNVDEQLSCSDLCEEKNTETRLVSSINGTSFIEVVSTSSSALDFGKQSNKKENVSCEYVVFDKEDLKELGDMQFSNEISGYDNSESTISDSELAVHGDEVSSCVKGDHWQREEKGVYLFDPIQIKHNPKDPSSNAQVSFLDACKSECIEKHEILEDTVTGSVEVIPISSELEMFEEQSNKKLDNSSPKAVLVKEHDKKVEEQADGEIAGCGSLASADQGSELPSVVEDKVLSILEEDKPEQEEKESNAEVSFLDACESDCIEMHERLEDTVTGSVEVTLISSELEKCDEQSNTKLDDWSPKVVLGKEQDKKVEEREADREITGCDSLDSADRSSEFPSVVGVKVLSILEEDNPELEEKEVTESAKVISISSDLETFEEQSNKKIDDLSPNAVCKQEFKTVDEIEANGEIIDCDSSNLAGRGSELPSVVGEEISSTLEEEKPAQEKEVNVLIYSSNLKGSKCVGNKQRLDSTDVQEQQLILPDDVISSQVCNASKLPEAPSVQPCQSNPVKPKRRLRPASSVMLRNINILDFDDATEMPKKHHGKRGEKEDVSSKRTKGSISLLRLLKQNIHQ